MGRLFGTDGIRGVANRELTCETALRLGAAAAQLLARPGERPVFAIGTDTRISSDMLMLSVAAGLCAAGADVLLLGVIPTPAVAFLTVKWGCAAGVVISASHNPPEFNGIKLFSAAGMKLPDELEERIEQLMESGAAPVSAEAVGRVRSMHDSAVSEYIAHLRASAGTDLTGMRLAIDCANGASAVTAEKLFTSLGAEAHMLGCDMSGRSINTDCGSTHMESLCRYVVDNRLDAGVAFDGDADRCLFTDENGGIVDGDAMLAIFARDMQLRGELAKNSIVGTVMSNLGLIKFCRDSGIGFTATKVGDRYVLEELMLTGGSLGGEQSGHIIFPELTTTGDGQLTALMLLAALRRAGVRLSELAAIMTRYPQHMVNIRVSETGKAAFYTHPGVNGIIENARALLGADGRLLVRLSGTEPVIRIMAEGTDTGSVRAAAELAADKLGEILG